MSDDKAMARMEEQRRYRAFLDSRVPELHRLQILGADARVQADQEYAAMKRRER